MFEVFKFWFTSDVSLGGYFIWVIRRWLFFNFCAFWTPPDREVISENWMEFREFGVGTGS